MKLLGWASGGAGRILASPTVFEDVVKTICTTNCAWSATVRMTTALVELGGGAFPEPELLAATPESWYRDVARMGYRGPYVRSIASDVAAGKLDLESLTDSARHSDEEAEEMLLALPGIGPYGAAHVMQLLGRHRLLVLDSWTRPTYLRLTGKKRAADSTIRARLFALRRLCRARVLALPDEGLDRRSIDGKPLPCDRFVAACLGRVDGILEKGRIVRANATRPGHHEIIQYVENAGSRIRRHL